MGAEAVVPDWELLSDEHTALFPESGHETRSARRGEHRRPFRLPALVQRLELRLTEAPPGIFELINGGQTAFRQVAALYPTVGREIAVKRTDLIMLARSLRFGNNTPKRLFATGGAWNVRRCDGDDVPVRKAVQEWQMVLQELCESLTGRIGNRKTKEVTG